MRATLRLLCPGSDFVDLVVFERRDVLDDKGQGGVDWFSDSVGLTTLLRSADQRHDGALLPSASVSAHVGPDGTAATTVGCGTTPAHAATPSTCGRHERGNVRASSAPTIAPRTPKHADTSRV